MQPFEKRRLGAEQAILRKFKTFKACNEACIRFAEKYNINTSFMSSAVARYVSAQTNFSSKRLHVLSSVLHVNDYRELDEIYTAPQQRGVGHDWVGEFGSSAKDIDIYLREDF